MTSGDQADEYKDLSDNMRHYANMRFAQLTLYFAFSAGLITVLFTVDPPLHAGLRRGLMLVGAVGAAAFGIMEERAADYWHHFRCRAEELEQTLAYRQYTDRPAGKVITATNATRVMVWGGVPLWLLAVVCGA
jgi:hypothetical protein